MTEKYPLQKLDPDSLLRLEPEEAVPLLLLMLKSRWAGQEGEISRNVFVEELRHLYGSNPYGLKAIRVLMEAWNWMVTHGLIAPSAVHKTGDGEFLTRAAFNLKTEEDFDNFRKASLLSPKLLHPVIAEKAWPTFIRGKHDTAVFEAFKEVEVAVRDAGGYDLRMFGTVLMRKAFDPDNGPLTDNSLPIAERN